MIRFRNRKRPQTLGLPTVRNRTRSQAVAAGAILAILASPLAVAASSYYTSEGEPVAVDTSVDSWDMDALIAAALDAPTAPVELNFDFDRHGLPETMHGGTIFHAWNMTFNDIREQLPAIAEAGFGTIQTSPIGESITQFPADDPQVANLAIYPRTWWMLYQPSAWRIGNMLGSEADFRALTTQAAEHGIHVIVDAIPNHMTTWWNGIDEPLREPWITWPGAVPGDGSWYDANISDWANRYNTTRRRLVGLVELEVGQSISTW